MAQLHPKAFYLLWWSVFWGFLVAFAFIGFFLSFVFIESFKGGILNFFVMYALAVLIVSLVVSSIWGKLLYKSYSYEMSKTSLNVKWGVVRKHSATIPYQRIQNIDINRGIMARILGLSEVWIQTAGFSAGLNQFGALRFSEGIIPGLDIKEAEKMRSSLLKKIKGKRGL